MKKTREILYYSKKETLIKSLNKKKAFVENLLLFLKLHKDGPLFFMNIKGVKFLICFSKILKKSIFYEHLKYHPNRNLKFINVFGTPLITSVARFYREYDEINAYFFENIQIEKIHLSKIYLEESVDELKTYLDEKLILLILKNNPIVGNCWLGIESNPLNNRNFWFQVIFSCFNFMTTVESDSGKIFGCKNFEIFKKKDYLKDSEFEYLRILEKKGNFMYKGNQDNKYTTGINYVSKHYQSSKIKNYLKNISWKNRVFNKKKIHNKNFLFRKKRYHTCSELLVY